MGREKIRHQTYRQKKYNQVSIFVTIKGDLIFYGWNFTEKGEWRIHMKCRFLLGRANREKSNEVVQEIRKKLREKPRGPAIFYIVPDQMTFQQEYELFGGSDIQGSMRAQVVSFSRLAWRVLQETGGGTEDFISSIGIQMLLKKVIDDRATDWKLFQKSLEKPGFLDHLEQLITEFKRYQISPADLQIRIEQLQTRSNRHADDEVLIQKLEDIHYIYEKLSAYVAGKYMDNEDHLQLLMEKIPHASSLEGAEIYIDGYHRFTPQELQLIATLMKTCRQTTIILTKDENLTQPNELDLFYQPTRTYQQVRAIAQQYKIPIENDFSFAEEESRFYNRPPFKHLEKHFDTRPAPAYEGEAPIQLAEAVHPRSEVEGVAQEIIRLVREENYRYRDMAIFIRDTETYHDLMTTIFGDYNIPLFIDEKESMLNHPLIELIRSLLDLVETNWRYEAVFRVLKTGFIPATNNDFPLTNTAIDTLENYVLEYGIRSRKSWTEESWVFQRFYEFDQAVQTDVEKETEDRLNAYREQVVQAIGTFDEEISNAETVEDFCRTIYLMMEGLHIPEQLEKMRSFYDEQGKIEKGREQDQVWEAMIQLLDEMVEMIGTEMISLSSFRQIIEAGLETLKFAHVPPTMDHVIVGTVEHSRVSHVKCAFLLGVNDGKWPQKPPTEGIINDKEREILQVNGIQLSESNERKLLDDWFYMYNVFTIASDHLWVSYVLSDEEGKTRFPSQLIQKMQDLFPACKEPILLQDPDELVEANRFITTPYKTRSALTTQLARNQRGYPTEPIWLHVLNWYIHHHEKDSLTYKILQSLYYENKPDHLTEETTRKIYPKTIQTSVSRLESFYRCSFQHFAQYSLQLKERRTYKLDAPDIGQLFHEALKYITNLVQADGIDLAQLSEGDTKKYAAKAIEQLAPILQHQILLSSNRYRYIQKKLEDVIHRATFILSEQSRRSGFAPIGIELGFGNPSDPLKPLEISLPNGFQLLLRGRIDRVDQMKNEAGLFLRIIDYKSSDQRLHLLEVYYGIALQMLAYLDVIISQSEQWLGIQAKPAGILYFHVHDAMLSEEDEVSDDKLFQEIFKQYKMQGLLLSEPEIVQMMDTNLESGVSDIVPAGLKKDGGFYHYSKVANEETFASLRNHIHTLVYKAGVEMTTGKIRLNPFEHKQDNACRFCPFMSVCQFDPTLEENNYRRLDDVSEPDILSRLKEVEKEGLDHEMDS